MSRLAPYSHIRARNDRTTSTPLAAAGERKDHSAEIIATVVIRVTGILVIGLWMKGRGALLYRRYQKSKTAKEKSVSNQKSLYLATRPVTGQMITSPVSELYRGTFNVHTQLDLEANLARIDSAIQCDKPDSTGTTIGDAVAGSKTELGALELEQFPIFYPQYGLSMESAYDVELRPLRESYQTDSTVATIESIGVAVPIKIPIAVRPSEVYRGL